MSHADDDRPNDGDEADGQRHARAVDDAAELVARVAVEAEPVLGLIRRAAQDVDARRQARLHALLDADQHLGGAIVGDDVGEDREENRKPMMSSPTTAERCRRMRRRESYVVLPLARDDADPLARSKSLSCASSSRSTRYIAGVDAC